jgi:Holliday junction resolvase-like predicted endonuclease
VEVKTRRSGALGPVELSSQQRHRLTRMAYRYLQSLREPFETVQFVVASVSFVDGTPQIEWIEHAFDSAF